MIMLMKKTITGLVLPAGLGLMAVLPFLFLELINRRGFQGGFPIPLFVFLWFLPTAFTFVLLPVLHTLKAGNKLLANPVRLWLRLAFLAFTAWLWLGILQDQMPCFMGVPNCD